VKFFLITAIFDKPAKSTVSEARQAIWSTKPETEFKVNSQILKKK